MGVKEVSDLTTLQGEDELEAQLCSPGDTLQLKRTMTSLRGKRPSIPNVSMPAALMKRRSSIAPIHTFAIFKQTPAALVQTYEELESLRENKDDKYLQQRTKADWARGKKYSAYVRGKLTNLKECAASQQPANAVPIKIVAGK